MVSVNADCFSGCLAKVIFEEQRDSRAWVCCVHWKCFCSDTLLIDHVDLSSSYLDKAFFLARRDAFIPQAVGAGFVSPDCESTGCSSWFLKGMHGNESASWWRCDYWREKVCLS